MYYLELIKQFWEFNNKNKIGSTRISMYLYLLKMGYENDSYSFQISDIEISRDLGLTRKTVRYTKEILKDLGLIQFETKNGIPCHYRLILNYPLHISKPKKTKKENLKTEKFAEKIDNSQIKNQTDFFTQKIPSFEEFIEYARTLDNYELKLDFEIQSKYEDWKKNEWKNGSNRPITNWKSSLKSSLPFMKNKIKNHQLSLASIPNIKRPKS